MHPAPPPVGLHPTELMPSFASRSPARASRVRRRGLRLPTAREEKSAFDVIEDASMFEDVGAGELFENSATTPSARNGRRRAA